MKQMNTERNHQDELLEDNDNLPHEQAINIKETSGFIQTRYDGKLQTLSTH